jgi:hypothetical protein
VILFVLFELFDDELLDAGFDPADLGEDLVGGGGPDERFGVGVPVLDVGADPADPCGASAVLAGLRPTPPSAAISACPACHAE